MSLFLVPDFCFGTCSDRGFAAVRHGRPAASSSSSWPRPLRRQAAAPSSCLMRVATPSSSALPRPSFNKADASLSVFVLVRLQLDKGQAASFPRVLNLESLTYSEASSHCSGWIQTFHPCRDPEFKSQQASPVSLVVSVQNHEPRRASPVSSA
jgi:hypothetical protein